MKEQIHQIPKHPSPQCFQSPHPTECQNLPMLRTEGTTQTPPLCNPVTVSDLDSEEVLSAINSEKYLRHNSNLGQMDFYWITLSPYLWLGWVRKGAEDVYKSTGFGYINSAKSDTIFGILKMCVCCKPQTLGVGANALLLGGLRARKRERCFGEAWQSSRWPLSSLRADANTHSPWRIQWPSEHSNNTNLNLLDWAELSHQMKGCSWSWILLACGQSGLRSSRIH